MDNFDHNLDLELRLPEQPRYTICDVLNSSVPFMLGFPSLPAHRARTGAVRI